MTENLYGIWCKERGWYTIRGRVFSTHHRGEARAQLSVVKKDSELHTHNWIVKIMAQRSRKPGPSENKTEVENGT